ncbi:ANL family adenylate-forming protein [Microbacterium sp. NPDC055357]
MSGRTNSTVARRVEHILAIDPASAALEFRGAWYTWGDLTQIGTQIQSILDAAGIAEGAAIAAVMRNRPATVATVFSVLVHGQTLVTVSSMQPDAALAAEIGGLPAAVLLADPEDWARPGVREAAAVAGTLAISVDVGGAVVLEALRRDDAEEHRSPGTAVLMLTSGTTGPPKRVPLEYAAFDAGYSGTAHYEGGESVPRLRDSVALVIAPLLHVSGIFTLLLNVQAGRKIALLERFVVEDWLALVTEHRPKAITLPPTALRMVMAAGVEPELLSFARSVLVGTAPISPEDQAAWEERYGIPILVVYGATEFAGGIAGWTLEDHRRFIPDKRGSVGRAHPGVDLRITDEFTGEPVPTDEPGILEVRAAQLGAKGRDWVRTTDRARLDSDGFLWVLGRADDVIIRGGFKISAGAVVEALKRCPAVVDAGVVGLADARLGEVPIAAVELATGAEVTEDDLRDYVRQHLTPYQVPTEIHIVEQLPRTPSLKVSSPGLRTLIAAIKDGQVRHAT